MNLDETVEQLETQLETIIEDVQKPNSEYSFSQELCGLIEQINDYRVKGIDVYTDSHVQPLLITAMVRCASVTLSGLATDPKIISIFYPYSTAKDLGQRGYVGQIKDEYKGMKCNLKKIKKDLIIEFGLPEAIRLIAYFERRLAQQYAIHLSNKVLIEPILGSGNLEKGKNQFTKKISKKDTETPVTLGNLHEWIFTKPYINHFYKKLLDL